MKLYQPSGSGVVVGVVGFGWNGTDLFGRVSPGTTKTGAFSPMHIAGCLVA
jgi:hypothetical protein